MTLWERQLEGLPVIHKPSSKGRLLAYYAALHDVVGLSIDKTLTADEARELDRPCARRLVKSLEDRIREEYEKTSNFPLPEDVVHAALLKVDEHYPQIQSWLQRD